jgi:predicted dehydrogenase
MRFGLFGTGPWASLTQAPALAAHPDVEFVGICGRDAGKTAALARRYDVAAYTDVDALVADVDAVSIALPPDVQAEIARRAAQAGKHLLLDKPIALTTGGAELIVGEVAKRGLASVVFFTSRFVPEIDDVLRAAAEVEGWHGARITHLSSIFTPENPFGASPWRREHGGLWDVGPHALSLVLPVLGSVEEVSAMTGPRSTTHVLLRHTGGAVSTLALSVDAATASLHHEAVFFGEPETLTVPALTASVPEAFGRAVTQLIRAAGGGDQPACDARFGLEVVSVLATAEASALSGKTLTI